MKQNKMIDSLVLWPVCGWIYYIFIRITGFSVGCLFRALTGLKCPGCGLTTMIVYLGDGDIRGAFQENEAMFLLLPFFCGWYLNALLRCVCGCDKRKKENKHWLIVISLYMMAFGIWRNL